MSEQRRSHGLLPTAHRPLPTVQGVITIAQEDRIRLVDAAGRGYLFILGKGVRRSLPELWALARERRPVTVVYAGTPDLGAVATALRPEPPSPDRPAR